VARERENAGAQQQLQLALLILAANGEQVPVVPSAEEQSVGPAELLADQDYGPAVQKHALGGRRNRGDHLGRQGGERLRWRERMFVAVKLAPTCDVRLLL